MELSWRRIVVHTRYPFRIARPGSSVSDDGTRVERIIVRVEDGGWAGFGEAAPTPYYRQSLDSVEETLKSARGLLGDDLNDIDAQVDRLLEAYPDQRATIAAIDEALHDRLGKARGMPVWRMLGLDNARVEPTSMTLGIDKTELIPQKLQEAVQFPVVKIKVGTDQDLETLELVRRLAPDKRIRVDANCGWTPEMGVQRVQQMETFNVELIEQPLPAGMLDEVARLRRLTRLPLIADEDAPKLEDVAAVAGAYTGVNVKLSKCGGIREGKRLIEAARGHGLLVMLGCMVETSLGVSAAAQLASLADYVDLDGHLLLRDDPFEGLRVNEGVVRPADQPGLGVRAFLPP
jgi:L-alanine-DL-glutamate epimerase-like enolase superfamily enzyme